MREIGSMREQSRSLHISYCTDEHELRGRTLRNRLCTLVSAAAETDGVPSCQFRVLDAGCGLGLLGRDLRDNGFDHIVGLDGDPVCLSRASRHMPCVRGDVAEIGNLFQERSFDAVVLSHVLEHMERPVDVVKSLLSVSKWLIVAVPNPTRLQVVLRLGFMGKDYANRGHLYSWDKSHLTRFLEIGCGLTLHRWASDGVRIAPGRVREFLRIGIDKVETEILPRYLPALSTSLIVLCEKGNSTHVDESAKTPCPGPG